MFFNFLSGKAANLYSRLTGTSVGDFGYETYPLEEATVEKDTVSYIKRDRDGNYQRLGLYLQYYKRRYLVDGRSPSLHIDICDNVTMLKHIMRATNSPFVNYYETETHREFVNVRLKVCKKCLANLRERLSISIKGTTLDEFLLSVEENEKTMCKTSNADGYAMNWRQISRAYRETRDYKCEQCGYHLKDMTKTKFMQTHHIDPYAKMNNKRSNLKCLCVKCHSEVDEHHRRQFESFENQMLLSEFDEYRLFN